MLDYNANGDDQMSAFLAKKMKYFMVTMEERNFSKAAEALCITRSPLSKAICELEEFLDGQLFNRTYNNLEPTELAWNYYYKCKPIYEALQELENECRFKKTENSLNIKFDVSLPEIFYQNIVMALQSQQVSFTAERMVINLGDIEEVSTHNNTIILSLRDITLNGTCDVDKWQGDELVLFGPENISEKQQEIDMFVWKDLYTSYTQASVNRVLEEMKMNINFIPHNYSFTELLYNIHLGNGCALLPRKMATLFKLGGSKQIVVKNKRMTIFLYRPPNNKCNQQITKVKHIVNTIL